MRGLFTSMKRFTETNKWEDPWFRKLKPEMKLLWAWLLDSCDNAGVIDADIELASFQIGYAYPMDTLSEFGHRVIELPCKKFFIPKFIEFQYGNLSRDCKAHNPIFISLEKHGLKGYPKGMDTLQEKEKEKDTETETEKEPPKKEKKLKPTTEGFEEFWAAYPKKVAKADAEKAWDKIRPDLETVLTALSWQRKSDDWTKDGGRYIQYPASYLNSKRYQDEKPKPKSSFQPQSCL